MIFLYVIIALISIALALFMGCITGRICVQIVRDKNSEMNEVLWFWFGFLLSFIAILCTLAVPDRRE